MPCSYAAVKGINYDACYQIIWVPWMKDFPIDLYLFNYEVSCLAT